MLKYFYIFAALSFVFLIMVGKAHAKSKNFRAIDNDLKKISKPYVKVG